MGEVNLEIDGIWCPTCMEMHPALLWHEKFDSYLLKRRVVWEQQTKKRPNLFIGAVYKDRIPSLGLMEHRRKGTCVCCGEWTHFSDLKTKQFICSLECQEKNDSNNL
ncbi:hypothetical protein [Streptococcus suis]|uniref:hypothetical protein n=1 Tax=Streptococcus suis TaxID=1307 RepID=UPI0012900D0E|nr:hypothetical protein [Streptococcus suis]